MTLDLSKPRGERVLIPGRGSNARPAPLAPDVMYFMQGEPNVFEVWGTVAGLLRKGGYPDLSTHYRDTALAQSDSYEQVIHYTEQFVHVLRLP